MKRTGFKMCVISLLIASFQVAYSGNQKAQKSNLPNIVYILADDLGIGDLGCYGQTVIKTPNIDKLASQGMLFSNHYSGCTLCVPSRSLLMTGQHT